MQFQEDFHELLKGLYVENVQSITDEKRWRSVKNMKIILASQVILFYDKNEQPCEVYEYATDETGRYVLMIGGESPDKFDERLTSVLFEIFKTVINIEDPASALGNSFRDLWKFPGGKLRDALIQRNEDENIWYDADLFFDGTAITAPEADIISENKKLFIKCRDDNLNKFKRVLYARLSAASLNEQKLYLTEIDKYKSIEPAEDSLQESPCDVLSLLLSIAPAGLLTGNDNDIDVDAIGKETKQKLEEEFLENKNELNVFLTGEYDSLLRFGNFDFLENAFNKHLDKMKADEKVGGSSAASPKRPIVVDSSNSWLSHTSANDRKRNDSHNGGNNYTDYSSRQAQNANVGMISEKIVYDHLVSKHGKSAVNWVSQFAKEENENLDGSDRTHYDIEYRDNGTQYFVEVKTNSGTYPIFSFNLTSTERSFAIKNENYQIFVVTAPKSDTPIINTFSWVEIKAFASTPTGYLVEFERHNRANLAVDLK